MPKKDKKNDPKALPSQLRKRASGTLSSANVYLPPAMRSYVNADDKQTDEFDDDALAELFVPKGFVDRAARAIGNALVLNPDQDRLSIQVKVPGPDDDERYMYMDAVRAELPLKTTAKEQPGPDDDERYMYMDAVRAELPLKTTAKKQPGAEDDDRYEYMAAVRAQVPLNAAAKKGVFKFPVSLSVSSNTDAILYDVSVSEEQLALLRKQSWDQHRASPSSDDSGNYSMVSDESDVNYLERINEESELSVEAISASSRIVQGVYETPNPTYATIDSPNGPSGTYMDPAELASMPMRNRAAAQAENFPGFSEVPPLLEDLRESMAALGFSAQTLPAEAEVMSAEDAASAYEEDPDGNYLDIGLDADEEAYGFGETDVDDMEPSPSNKKV